MNDRKRVKRAAQEVSKDMLRGHIPENKTVCPPRMKGFAF